MPTGRRNSKLKVTVALLSGRTFSIAFLSDTTVKDFKMNLANHTYMDWFSQRLFYESRELNDEVTLLSASVRHGATLSLILDEDIPPPLVGSSDEEY